MGIVPKIEEVDRFLNCEDDRTKEKRRALFREAPPEVCFRALNGNDLQHPKKKRAGSGERLSILKKHFPESAQAYKHIYCDVNKIHRGKMAEDDIVDALVAAITAKIGFGENGHELKTLQILPSDPPEDSCGLRMEMLYVELNRCGKD